MFIEWIEGFIGEANPAFAEEVAGDLGELTGAKFADELEVVEKEHSNQPQGEVNY